MSCVITAPNDPWFCGHDFSFLPMQYGFSPITSTLKYLQSNRLTDYSVKIANPLVKKSSALEGDPLLAVLL